MANIFTLENIEDFSEKLNIDELYEKKRNHDVNQLALFNKILNRVHVRIKTASRQKIDFQSCWYLVPETIIGVPKYDNAHCIAYIIDKLKQQFDTRSVPIIQCVKDSCMCVFCAPKAQNLNDFKELLDRNLDKEKYYGKTI